MKEWIKVRQIPGESKRRWFSSKDFDLIVWLSDDQSFPGDQTFTGFELCYNKLHGEHSITWNRTGGFCHMAVDDGEQRPGKFKATPILVPDGILDIKQLYLSFLDASRSLPEEIANFVLQALEQHPRYFPPDGT